MTPEREAHILARVRRAAHVRRARESRPVPAQLVTVGRKAATVARCAGEFRAASVDGVTTPLVRYEDVIIALA